MGRAVVYQRQDGTTVAGWLYGRAGDYLRWCLRADRPPHHAENCDCSLCWAVVIDETSRESFGLIAGVGGARIPLGNHAQPGGRDMTSEKGANSDGC